MSIDIESVKRWISENLADLTEPADVAIHFHVSLHLLRTEFSWRGGTSLSRYIRSERIKKGAELIQTSELNWFEIVARLHLGRPENASTLFKRQFGITVRQYERSYRRPFAQ
jgi:AraC-like DNA-binding protein